MFSFFKAKTNPQKNLQKILKGYELPSFPAVIMQILQKIRSPYASASDIADILSLDPGISVKLLSIANSAAFSPNKEIENLSQAIALVGVSQLESLVLGVGVAKCMPKSACPWHNTGTFWLTSARRAILADELARIICPSKESECFTASFLQDLALPFLVQHRPKDYEPILKQWQQEGGDLAELEKQRLPWDHTEVASWICAHWGLPENIAAAIRGHHGEEVDNHAALGPVRIVAILREEDSNSGMDEMFETAENEYGVEPEKIADMIAPAYERAADLARLIV